MRIEQLRTELEESKQAAEGNMFSTEWIKEKIAKKEIFIDEDGTPVIDIHVSEDGDEAQTRQ